MRSIGDVGGLDLLVASNEPTILSRARAFYEQHKFVVATIEQVAQIKEVRSSSIQVVFFDGRMVGGMTQALQAQSQLREKRKIEIFYMLVPNGIPDAAVQQLKSVGITPMPMDLFVHTSVFEYLAWMHIRGHYIEVQKNEIFQGTTIPYSVWHFMERNRRYVPIIAKGAELGDEKFNQLSKIKEVYLSTSDCDGYRKYIESFFDASGKIGIAKRTHAVMVQIYETVESAKSAIAGSSDFNQALQVVAKVEQFLADIMNYIKKDPEALSVVELHLDSTMLGFDVSWILCVFVELWMPNLKIGRDQIISWSLLTSYVRLQCPSLILRKFQQGGSKALSSEELAVLFPISRVCAENSIVRASFPQESLVAYARVMTSDYVGLSNDENLSCLFVGIKVIQSALDRKYRGEGASSSFEDNLKTIWIGESLELQKQNHGLSLALGKVIKTGF